MVAGAPGSGDDPAARHEQRDKTDRGKSRCRHGARMHSESAIAADHQSARSEDVGTFFSWKPSPRLSNHELV